jgi:hypothetical protein
VHDIAVRGTATFDVTGRYRYRLGRWWGPGPRVAFVMLNPNTADAVRDDPTIRRCVAFAKSWGCGSADVVNLFARRARDPRQLARAVDPVGPDNDRHLRRALREADLVVCAWGASPLARSRAAELPPILGGRPLRCLGLTKQGAPRHPLYLRRDTRLRRF